MSCGFAVLQKRPVVLAGRSLAWPFLNTQKNHSKGKKNKNEQTDEFGADQLGACIHINICTPGKQHSLFPAPPPPPVHVCAFLWQPQDACTTTPMNRDVFYFSAQRLCIHWAWRGARGCPSAWRPVFWQGRAGALSACAPLPPALRRRLGWECHFAKAACVELCKQ